MLGLNGSLVVLVATGGNSPLAEMKYNAFIEKAVLSFHGVEQWSPVVATLKKLKSSAQWLQTPHWHRKCGTTSRGHSLIRTTNGYTEGVEFITSSSSPSLPFSVRSYRSWVSTAFPWLTSYAGWYFDLFPSNSHPELSLPGKWPSWCATAVQDRGTFFSKMGDTNPHYNNATQENSHLVLFSIFSSRSIEAGYPVVTWLNHWTDESICLIRSIPCNQLYERFAWMMWKKPAATSEAGLQSMQPCHLSVTKYFFE